MSTRKIAVAALILATFGLTNTQAVLQSFIQMKDGYFFDPATGKAWVPHGIAYQTWNRPLGVWQTPEQIDYDLDQMKKMGANSIRVDFVWQHIEEDGDNVWSWTNYDYLVKACEERDLRIFALIGYQWPPAWFPNDWYTMHPPEVDSAGIVHTNRWQSDIIGYETPQARAQYAEFFSAVCARYKDSKAIVAWIVGNEYGYLGLWSGLLDGYDPNCEQAFRNWCQTKYGTISNVNATWGASYSNFSDIAFVDQYRAYGSEGAEWADMVQWREDSIAGYTALGASAAKIADTNHLISYSTVGMQWGEEDWRYHAEDRGKITQACAATNAPLDFFSVNNYPWSVLGHESQNGQWGISYTKKVAGVPVLYSETGFSSSETMWPGMNEQRQGPLIRNSLWESLEAGAIGTHIFAWHDRPYITDREKGFGILYANRVIKPAFWVSRNTFNLMEGMKIHELLMGSKDPKPDIAFLWTAANDSQYNRYECEMQQIAGALERLGYEPYFMNLNDLAAGAYTNYKVVILPRNMRVDNAVPGYTNSLLNFIETKVIPAGVHVLASADLPGLQDFNGRPRAAFTNEVASLFGVNASDIGGYELPERRNHYVSWYWNLMEVDFNSNAVGAVSNAYHYWPYVWKYSDEIQPTDGGVVWATMNAFRNKGFEDSNEEPNHWKTWNSGNMAIQHWFPMEGTNMLQMWGDAGIYQEFPVVPFGRYTASTYLRNNHDDPLRGGQIAKVQIEWYNEAGDVIGIAESAPLMSSTPSNSWVQYKVDAIAPSSAWTGRRIIRCGNSTNPPNLLANGTMEGTASVPTSWSGWNTSNFASEPETYHAASPSRAFWWDSGIWQDVTSGFVSNDVLKFGGWLFQPTNDALRNGKCGTIEMELYNRGTRLATWTAQPPIQSTSPSGTWIYTEGTATVPASTTLARIVIRCNASGDGRFNVDDVFLNDTTPGGAVYVDNAARAPALIVKDHSAAKSAIFLYSAGDMRPDGNLDGDPDIYDWKWRYDVFGSVVRDYFGVQPLFTLVGTNACYAMAEYRTCTNGATLWQIKNYLYDTNYTDGGDPQTFTIRSSLFQGKTVRAFEQGRILATNCGDTVQVTLDPDGQEILLVYSSTSNQPVCQIVDAPSVVHPFGDKSYTVQVNYDTLDQTNLTLVIALVGGLNGSQTLQTVTTNVSGAGQTTSYIWIPDFDSADTNSVSSPDGGTYSFVTWLEDASGTRVTESSTQSADLEWGVRPMTNLPSTVEKGGTVNLPLEWEDLYEYLSWQNTPMTRGDAFPARVAIFRSTKTEKKFPGHFDRVNEVCNWLESMGYESGNDTDISFDNVIVSRGNTNSAGAAIAFSDSMESGTNGWVADGLWHLAKDLCFSASNSWSYNNGTHYNTGARNTGSLITPWISLSNASSAALSFRSWYETEDTGTSWDKKWVFVSSDGTNWLQVLQISGANKQWTAQTCDLSAYAGRRVQVKFVFDTVDAVYNGFKGWAVDDVTVTKSSGSTVDLFNDPMESTTNWTASGLWHQTGSRSGAEVSGTNRWVYNDATKTNYNTGARNSGSLISRWIDLTTASSAALSFQSWYKTEDTSTAWDRKILFVSTDGTNWTQLLRVSGPAQQWTVQTYDLGPYAGQRIQLKFFFDTIDNMNNGYEGWYIDDVRITTITGTGIPVFSDAVEDGTNGWDAAGLWHQANDLYVSAAKSWAYNNGLNYATGGRNSGALISPWIDLTAAAGASLNFRSWYETEDTGTSWDRKTVYVTADGTNWTQILQISGVNQQWTVQSTDLSLFAGQRIRLKFFFDTIDGVNNSRRGWYLDNIVVNMIGSDVLFGEGFATTNLSAWTRAAGAANWGVTNSALRAWRIGNDDNLLCAGDTRWSNYVAGVDIRYNKQGPYYNDAEIYVRYQDRDHFVKVGIQNYYDFWRLKYTVRVGATNNEQGWISEFQKTNRPVENTWYNLKVKAETNTFTVFFDGEEVGSFTPTNFPYSTGKVAIGTRAVQLGIWEPQKGYYFIDDDEYSYYSADEGAEVTVGSPLNLDWGYLVDFFPTLILPSTYVMSDVEVSNVVTWLNKGLFSLIATDGGIAMMDENGAADIGRIEGLFGAAGAVTAISNLCTLTVGTNDHYVTQDYAAGNQLNVAGTAMAWRSLTLGNRLGTANGSTAVPALIVNTLTNDPLTPKKVFCFNFGVDTQGQLTNEFRTIAQRAFEWARGEAHKIRIELKYTPVPGSSENNFVVKSWDLWVLGGTGTNLFDLVLPEDNIMTGDNMYWVIYSYAWDATNAWIAHDGFYTSANDGTNGVYTSIPGVGLQILGATDKAYGGRSWDLWAAYNTRGTNMVVTVGLKDKGSIEAEDNFNDGNFSGWHTIPATNNLWSVTPTGTLKCTTGTAGGYSILAKDNLNVSDQNVTFEYDVKFDSGTEGGGIVYRGHVLYINPQGIYWSTDNPLTLSGNTSSNFSGLVTNADGSVSYVITGTISIYIGPAGLSVGDWHHVSVSIRDGDPYLKSDILIDGAYAYMMESLPFTNWTDTGIGLLSPYKSGACEWDNLRIADEEYSFYTQTVNGEVAPTNAAEPTFWAYVPDYDPDMLEYEGSSLGGQYEWYAYFRGQYVHGQQDVNLLFAPRLMTEDTNFPTVINAGQTVRVPVEWENVTNLPQTLRVSLAEPFTGVTPVSNDFEITTASGSAYFTMTVPSNTASSVNYLWSALLYPPGSSDPATEKLGLDDTFRFDTFGIGVEPEVPVSVSARSSDDQIGLFNDGGLSAPADIFKWWGSSAVFDGEYTNVPAPEGVESFYCSGNYWQGWGIFSVDQSLGTREPRDLRAYKDGFLKFWLKSSITTKVQIEDNSGAPSSAGIKGTVYVPSTSNVWKEITIPISDFVGPDLSSLYGLFSISTESASTFYVDDVRWVKGVYRIYRDDGILSGATVDTWYGSAATFNGDFADASAPEGVKCFLTDGDSWAGWGVSLTNATADLSLYSNGVVHFWAKSTKPLKISVEGPQGTKRTNTIASTGNAWQEFALPVTGFSGVNLSQIYSPFQVTAETGATFFVDDVYWRRGTNGTVAAPKSMIYWDSGLPAGTDVFVWWASQYWSHVSATLNDGGFENDSAGSFPDAGFWTLATAGSSATAQCLTAAAHTGSNGLRAKAGNETTSTWTSVYQEHIAYAGDIYHAQAYVRQPSGQDWTASSVAYVRLQFLDAWHQGLTNVISSSLVSAAGQTWTLCEITNATAPSATRYVRLDLVVLKPSGASGAAVADFDGAVLQQANSFNGQFAEDPAPPEGVTVFRSYCVNWSGWGIFYTNTVVDMSTYSNGYLKFWLKSSGYTRIELQSVFNQITNTVSGAAYSPTTDGAGTIVWQHKVIPITNFTGVVLTHIKSPFMVTDPVYDNSYSVDYVTWELNP